MPHMPIYKSIFKQVVFSWKYWVWSVHLL